MDGQLEGGQELEAKMRDADLGIVHDRVLRNGPDLVVAFGRHRGRWEDTTSGGGSVGGS